jgi:hypothetical protein
MVNQRRKVEALPGILVHTIRRLQKDKVHPPGKRREPFYML